MIPTRARQFNQRLIEDLLAKRRDMLRDPARFQPWLFRPCRVRVLLVTDGGLDFSADNFGLSTLVSILADDGLPYVRFEITAGHRTSGTTGGEGNHDITRNIGNFRFDNADHFAPGMYDQVWIFGIESSQRFNNVPPASELDARNQWAPRLSETELRALSEFMNAGGGLFATGDHGALGASTGGFIPRARSMRRWFFPGPGPFNEPGSTEMTSGARHDTNQPGHDPATQFNDQSDDIPQPIDPKLYTRFWGWRWFRWPHPLLCGPDGAIRILPDHPHEGECAPPHELNRTFTFSGFSIEEYPSTASGVQVRPEVIATSRVLAGSTADFAGKQPTSPESFGAICAYDGARVNVGRVVTDATWHHFVNVNLVGDKNAGAGDPKLLGFLASTAGEGHFEIIKAYYLNIAQWIAPPNLRRCMRLRAFWYSLWSDRLLEAVTPGHPVQLAGASLHELTIIGQHARDVLDRFAGRCQTYGWLIDWLAPRLAPPWRDVIDPWGPLAPDVEKLTAGLSHPGALADLALGAIVVSLREAYPDEQTATKSMRSNEVEQHVDRLIDAALGRAMDLAAEGLDREYKFTRALLGR